MNLTRKQELALIDMGLKQLLNNLVKEPKKDKVVEKPKGRKWTKEQRAKFAKTMSKVWKNKQAKVKDES